MSPILNPSVPRDAFCLSPEFRGDVCPPRVGSPTQVKKCGVNVSVDVSYPKCLTHKGPGSPRHDPQRQHAGPRTAHLSHPCPWVGPEGISDRLPDVSGSQSLARVVAACRLISPLLLSASHPSKGTGLGDSQQLLSPDVWSVSFSQAAWLFHPWIFFFHCGAPSTEGLQGFQPGRERGPVSSHWEGEEDKEAEIWKAMVGGGQVTAAVGLPAHPQTWGKVIWFPQLGQSYVPAN